MFDREFWGHRAPTPLIVYLLNTGTACTSQDCAGYEAGGEEEPGRSETGCRGPSSQWQFPGCPAQGGLADGRPHAMPTHTSSYQHLVQRCADVVWPDHLNFIKKPETWDFGETS